MDQNLKTQVKPEHTALIVVDMQRDYCCEGGVIDKLGFSVEPAKQLATRLAVFATKARQVLSNIVHLKMTLLSELRSDSMAQHYKRVGLEREYDPSFGDFYGVTPLRGEVVIPKYRYSGFVSTYLDQYLRAQGIKTVVVVGVATNVCVESTVRDAFMRDYHVIVPEDMTEGTCEEAKQWSLRNIDAFFGRVVESQHLLQCWNLD